MSDQAAGALLERHRRVRHEVVVERVAPARAQRLTNVRFERAAVSDWLQRTPAWEPTKIVLDPPRTGAVEGLTMRDAGVSTSFRASRAA